MQISARGSVDRPSGPEAGFSLLPSFYYYYGIFLPLAERPSVPMTG
jgi:hypothetical protein